MGKTRTQADLGLNPSSDLLDEGSHQVTSLICEMGIVKPETMERQDEVTQNS
jgi:hypothetical protein